MYFILALKETFFDLPMLNILHNHVTCTVMTNTTNNICINCGSCLATIKWLLWSRFLPHNLVVTRNFLINYGCQTIFINMAIIFIVIEIASIYIYQHNSVKLSKSIRNRPKPHLGMFTKHSTFISPCLGVMTFYDCIYESVTLY